MSIPDKISLSLDIKDFYCPITREIFCEPVTADDGIIYERNAIEHWLTENNTSPITREEISEKFVDCNIMKNFVKYLLQLYPDLKLDQFVKDNKFRNNMREIMRHITNKEYNRLFDYTEYDLENLSCEGKLTDILECVDDDTILYIYNNCIDEQKQNDNIMEIIAQYASPNIKQYIISRYYDAFYILYNYYSHFDSNTFQNIIKNTNSKIESNSVIDMLSTIYHDYENSVCLINKCIEKNFCFDSLLYILIDGDKNEKMDTVINYILDNCKTLNINYKNGSCRNYLHCSGLNERYKIFQKLVHMGIDLNCSTDEGWTPFHVALYYCDKETILFLIGKKIDFRAKIKRFNEKESNYGFRELINLNKNLSKRSKKLLIFKITQKLDSYEKINNLNDSVENKKDLRNNKRNNKKT